MTTDILDQIQYPESMDGKKKNFLKEAVLGSQGKNKNNMLPYLTSLIKKAKEENIRFSNLEIQFILTAIKAASSPEEKDVIEKICNLNPKEIRK